MHSYNEFKENLKQMSHRERLFKLKELQNLLMYAKARTSWRTDQEKGYNVKKLRKLIAITKTALNNWR